MSTKISKKKFPISARVKSEIKFLSDPNNSKFINKTAGYMSPYLFNTIKKQIPTDEGSNFFFQLDLVVPSIPVEIPETFMSEESLMLSHNAQQNSINITYDIERVNANRKFRTKGGSPPYSLVELKNIAKSLGLNVASMNKESIVNSIIEKHNLLMKN